MQDEVTPSKLKPVVGKKVEIHAFGITFSGTLTRVDTKAGLIRVEDKDDYVLLEIERVDFFKVVRPGSSVARVRRPPVRRRSKR